MFREPETQKIIDWSDIPEEIKLHTLKNLYPSDLSRYSQADQASYKLLLPLWKAHYEKNFGVMEFKSNAKIQYIAAQFYALANQCKRWDRAQMLFKQLHQFLQAYAEEPWAAFYFGAMLFEGKGLVCHPEEGLAKLKESFNNQDSRAAIFIAEILLNAPMKWKGHENNREFIMEYLGDDFIQSLLLRLITRYKQGMARAAKLITNFYIEGIIIDYNEPEQLEKWLVNLMEIDRKAGLEAYIKISLSELQYYAKEEVEQEKILNNINIFLNDWTYEEDAIPVANYFVTYLEWHYPYFGRFNLHQLRSASKANYIPAMTLLADVYFELSARGNNEKNSETYRLDAKNLLQEAFIQGAEVQEVIPNLLKPEICIPFYKSCLLKGNHLAAAYLGATYSIVPLHFLMPQDIVWLQLAAQHGGVKSLEILKKFTLKKVSIKNYNPYALAALSIIYSHGIKGSAIGADEVIASSYRKAARGIKEDIFEKYINVMQQEGIFYDCPEMEKLLLKELTPVKPEFRPQMK